MVVKSPKPVVLKKVNVRIPQDVHAAIVRISKSEGVLVERLYLEALRLFLQVRE